ncbi:hypothetical protein EW146_g5256 [Bondarzewia mesenterica]|uniref:Reverse transcriptase domain-containing protein n=1 Tax=Bondarzewia mesenterica TaxID=1095465 RepID=A0A4V3XEW2_9AGAM|nr:hypothetical protein EW146_g5256 [Bondarzewia mesenterica]
MTCSPHKSSSLHREVNLRLVHLKREVENLERERKRFASPGIEMGDAIGRTASSSISALSAGLPHTPTLIVHKAPHASKPPRFLRGFLWSGDQKPVTPSASATETAAPLPSIPDHFLHDETSWSTIRDNLELFKIITTVNVDRFEYLLQDHPNPAFVQSVVRGLRIGFWPCAEGPGEGYLESWDESRDSFTPEGLAFIKEQCRQEERLGHFSAPFKDLLSGMYSMPIHAVPKPHTDSFRMVVDHSAGNYSLNLLIDRDAVGMHLDNVQDLACNLLSSRSEVGDAPIWLFKSDVSQAYRQLPMHPLWQIKQIVTVDGEHQVDRCNNFRDRAGGFIWCSFFELVLWIAINIRRILELLAYVDDTFGHDVQAELVCYKPYDAYYPTKQVCLLEL